MTFRKMSHQKLMRRGGTGPTAPDSLSEAAAVMQWASCPAQLQTLHAPSRPSRPHFVSLQSDSVMTISGETPFCACVVKVNLNILWWLIDFVLKLANSDSFKPWCLYQRLHCRRRQCTGRKSTVALCAQGDTVPSETTWDRSWGTLPLGSSICS